MALNPFPGCCRRTRSASSRVAATALAAGMLAAMAVVGIPTPADAASRVTEDRLWGADRYETAAEIATGFVNEVGPIDTVIIASGEAFADALAATPLSRVENAPILLTPPDALAESTRAFIERHRVTEIIIAGGPQSVSDDVEDSLNGLIDGVAERLEGANRYRTVTNIAREIDADKIGSFCGDGRRTALLATGVTFADALALSPLAFAGPHPVLLTNPERLSRAAEDFVLDYDIDQVIIAGGPAAIAPAVEDELVDLDIRVRRLWGRDRFGTAVEIAEVLSDSCFETDHFALADGWKFPDALVGGTLLGLTRAPLLLTEPVLPDATRAFLGGPIPDRDTVRLTIFGGPAAVAPSVAGEAVDALRGLARDCDPRTDEPGAPRDLAVSPFDEGLVVSWTPPSTVGSDAPTGYRLRFRPAGGEWTTMSDVHSPTEITGLQNRTLYEVQVRADGDQYRVWTPSAWATPSSAVGTAIAAASDPVSSVVTAGMAALVQHLPASDPVCPPAV